MAAKIRLTRIGTKSRPVYRVIVIDESSARNGSPIETLGSYDPKKEPSLFEVKTERVQYWLSKGALPSPTLRKYFGKIGIMPAVNFDKTKKKAPKEKKK